MLKISLETGFSLYIKIYFEKKLTKTEFKYIYVCIYLEVEKSTYIANCLTLYGLAGLIREGDFPLSSDPPPLSAHLADKKLTVDVYSPFLYIIYHQPGMLRNGQFLYKKRVVADLPDTCISEISMVALTKKTQIYITEKRFCSG